MPGNSRLLFPVVFSLVPEMVFPEAVDTVYFSAVAEFVFDQQGLAIFKDIDGQGDRGEVDVYHLYRVLDFRG